MNFNERISLVLKALCKKTNKSIWSVLWFLILATTNTNVLGLTLDQLVADGHLRINVSVAPEGKIAVSQEINLMIDVETTGWFAGGTEIKLPELKNAIIMQRDQFATNSTFKEGYKTWVSQRWEISVFPMEAGTLTIPDIELIVNINASGQGIVSGKVITPELLIDVLIPPEIQGVESWLASPELRIQQSFDKPLDALKVGDAFKQTVIITGEHSLAMMLPGYPHVEVEGLAVYPKQPQLNDINSRGVKRGERIEVLDYIVEAEGRYQLPETHFHFWNTETKTHEEIILPETTIEVGVGVTKSKIKQVSDGLITSKPIQNWKTLAVFLSMVILVILLVTLTRKYFFNNTGSRGLTPRRIARNIKQASHSGDLKKLAAWLYVWMDYNDSSDKISLRAFVRSFNSPQLYEQVEVILQGAYSHREIEGQILIKVPNSTISYLGRKFEKLSKHKIKLSMEP